MPSASAARRLPTQTRAKDRVDAILDAAAALLAETGWEAFNTNAVARKAGVPVGSVYQYFPHKEAVVQALATRSIGRLETTVARLITPAALLDWEGMIDGFVDGLAEFWRKEPGIKAVWLADNAAGRPRELERESDRAMAGRVADLLVARKLPAERAGTVATTLVQITGPLLSLAARLGPKRGRLILEETKRMMKSYLKSYLTVAVVVLMTGCTGGQRKKADVVLAPGAGAQERLQEALVMAQPGQLIELGAGVFELTRGLSLDASGVTLRGKGMGKTILSFAKQEAGGEGLLITGNNVLVEDLALLDTKGDGIKAKGSKGLTFRRVKTSWSGGPLKTNGGYGLYPVQTQDVLIEGCVASHASDSGIYVGQSKNVVVRNNRAEANVAGIEIENSRNVEVYGNVAAGNTGGFLIFALPDLPVKGGGDIKVHDNKAINNDLPNFAPPGNIVAQVPRGTGVLVMANENVEVYNNEVSGHPTVNLAVISYLVTGRPIKDPQYDPFGGAVKIHDNTFSKGGYAPDGPLGGLLAMLAGAPVPDIVWDGTGGPVTATNNGAAKLAQVDVLGALKKMAEAQKK